MTGAYVIILIFKVTYKQLLKYNMIKMFCHKV